MSDQYYVLLGEEAIGPLSKEQLFSMQSDRRVTEKTLICRVGDSEWKPMGEVFPSTEPVRPPAPPPVPPLSSKRSQQDRELLHEYLVTALTPQKESVYVRPSITDAIADAIPALGNLLGRRKAVVAGTTVSDSQTENTKREELFQQQRLLTLSATYMESAPWISYLTATKHSRFIECYGLTTSAFADFGDKKLVDETARLADELEVKSFGLMDSETRDFVRELISFQGRKEIVESAVSILNEIIRSPHRALIHCELATGKVEIPQNYPTLLRLPDGKAYETMCVICVIGTVVAGCVVAGSFAGVVEMSALHTNAVLFTTAMGLVGAIVFFTLWQSQRKAWEDENARYDYAFAREKQRVENILNLVNRLAGMFRSTVKPLLDVLKIAINLDDFEGMLSELVTYQTWALETERRYTST